MSQLFRRLLAGMTLVLTAVIIVQQIQYLMSFSKQSVNDDASPATSKQGAPHDRIISVPPPPPPQQQQSAAAVSLMSARRRRKIHVSNQPRSDIEAAHVVVLMKTNDEMTRNVKIDHSGVDSNNKTASRGGVGESSIPLASSDLQQALTETTRQEHQNQQQQLNMNTNRLPNQESKHNDGNMRRPSQSSPKINGKAANITSSFGASKQSSSVGIVPQAGTKSNDGRPGQVFIQSKVSKLENSLGTEMTEKQHAYLNKPEQDLIDHFHPMNAPILHQNQMIPRSLPRVRMLAMMPKKRKPRPRTGTFTSLMRDELVNIIWDGLFQANNVSFQLLTPMLVMDRHAPPVLQDYRNHEPEVWMVDTTYHVPKTYHYSLMKEVLRMAQHYYPIPSNSNSSDRLLLTVVFVNYFDKLAGTVVPCSEELRDLMAHVGSDRVRWVVGKVVQNRAWDATRDWINQGTIWNFSNPCDHSSFATASFLPPALRAPYTVRSDYVNAVNQLYPQFLDPQRTVGASPVDTIRPVDVWHHWDVQRQADRKDEYRKSSRLRTAVSQVVLALNGTTITIDDNNNHSASRTLQTRAESVSVGGTFGRTEVAQGYLETLLTAKIVVVAQRDSWEDHYRLFEAYVGGAMVMTDTMLSLPFGLVDGESIVMYRSRQHLRELLLHYLQNDKARLAVARKGFDVAMSRHRSYHRMEELFFGAPQSPASLPYNPLVIEGD